MTGPQLVTLCICILVALVVAVAIRDWRQEQRRDRREYLGTDYEGDRE